MWTRLIVCGGVFMPLSYYFSQLPMTNQTLKFMLIYGSLYLGNAIMGAIYIKRFRNQEWIKQALRNSA
jgi:Na+-driven multidrug efflux pump